MSQASDIKPEHSRITVGIVTYNSAGYIGSCIESVTTNLRNAAPTIIILDNNSHDDTVAVVKEIRKKHPLHLDLIESKTNTGYAAGVNTIAGLAQTEWLCFINPDARLLNPAFQYAKDVVRRYPTCGIIGGVIVDTDGKPQECGGVFPTPLMAVWDWCGLRHLFPLPRWSTTLKFELTENAPTRHIDYPTGAFWLLRREVYTRVGKFDERFFLYFEETDFCRRASRKQWPSYIHPGIRIEHDRGASFRDTGESTAKKEMDPLSIYFESLFKYLYKHFSDWRVKWAAGTIHNFLKIRKWLRKDAKSGRILDAFESGISRAGGLKLELDEKFKEE